MNVPKLTWHEDSPLGSGLLAAAACLLSGCTEGASTSDAGESTPATAAAVWSRTDLAIASSAVRVGNAAVLYPRQGDALYLTALDSQTGATLWNRLATFSAPREGIALGVTVLDEKWVAYLEPVERSLGEAFLVLLDPAGAGTELARSDKKLFLSFPSECDDDPSSACVRAWTRSSRHARFTVSMGGQALELPGDGRDSYRETIGGHGLVRYPAASGQKYVGVEKDGVMVWSKPEAELFGARYATEGGWRFRYSEATNAFIGTVGLSPDIVKSAAPVPMATSLVTLALDASTGAVRWSREGVDTFCDVDVTGQDSVDADPLLACEWQSGQRTINATGRSVSFDKPAMALSALDVQTGQSRWTAPIGEVALTQHDGTARLALVPDAVVVDRIAGAVRVSLGDGAQSPPDPRVVAWKRVPIEFRQQIPAGDGSTQDEFLRRGVVSEGILNGQVSDTVSLPLPVSVGARFDGGLAVLTTAKGVTGYRT